DCGGRFGGRVCEVGRGFGVGALAHQAAPGVVGFRQIKTLVGDHMDLLKRASTVVLGVLLWSVMGLAQAATYYVATTGSNSGNGSAASPWLTIGYGLSKLSGGDTLIVKPGTYYDLANFINANQSNIPNGTASQYTKVMAE